MACEREMLAGDHILFENFFPYIHIDDLNENIQINFLKFLKQLHRETMNEWMPGRCTEFACYESYAQHILSSLPDLSRHYQLTRHKFRLWHQWFNLEGDNEHTLIIDPAGIPLNFDQNPADLIIVPHFGLIEKAHRYAQEEYSIA